MSSRNASLTKCRSLIALVAFVGMVGSGLLVSMPTSVSAKPTQLSPPTISCGGSTPTSIDIIVCGGAQGAPAGFSIQWELKSDFDANGGVWPVNSDCPLDINGNPTCPASFCKASFSGVPGCATNFSLTGPSGTNPCVTVEIGDNLFDECGASSTCANQPLICNQDYVFRAFAHNVPGGLNKSDFTATLTCHTAPCGGGDQGCTFTQGYWKTHGPTGCVTGNNTNTWPVNNLTVGAVNYTDLQLCSIFNTPAGGNGLIALAHQLIAAKLNIASGAAPDAATAQCIVDADTLIGGLVIPPVGSDSLSPGATSTLTTCLDNFNTGLTGPGHCPP